MDFETKCLILIVLFVLLVGIVGNVIKTKVEQRTFNRCNNADITYWEAQFTHLRVDKCEISN